MAVNTVSTTARRHPPICAAFICYNDKSKSIPSSPVSQPQRSIQHSSSCGIYLDALSAIIITVILHHCRRVALSRRGYLEPLCALGLVLACMYVQAAYYMLLVWLLCEGLEKEAWKKTIIHTWYIYIHGGGSSGSTKQNSS